MAHKWIEFGRRQAAAHGIPMRRHDRVWVCQNCRDVRTRRSGPPPANTQIGYLGRLYPCPDILAAIVMSG